MGDFSDDNLMTLQTEVTCVNISTFDPDCYVDFEEVVGDMSDYRYTTDLLTAYVYM